MLDSLFRKLRATLVTAVLWAVPWSLWGLVAALVGNALDLQNPVPFRQFTIWYMVYRSAIVGFAAGIAFALILGVVYRRRSLDQLGVPAVAAWGTLAGILLPVAAGALTIDALGLAATPARVLTAALFFYVIPGLFTAYGTIKLARPAKQTQPA